MVFNILVPTDFSFTAEKAFLYALDIASRCAGTVFLYHVCTPIENPFIETAEKREQYNREDQRALMCALHALRGKWAHLYPDVNIITVLERSPIVGSILKFSLSAPINLIVMGTQGASGLKKVMIGTIAVRILGKSTVPLLLVPERFEWKEPEKFILATNYQHSDVTALTISWKLARLYNAFIEVVHLSEALADKEQVVFDEYIACIKMKFPELLFAASLLPIYSVTDALETLHEHVPYDVLVMVRHQRKFPEQFFGESRTKHMAYLTWKPLLVIPGDEDQGT